MARETSAPTDPGEVKECDAPKDASPPKVSSKGIRAMQGEPSGTETTGSPGDAGIAADALPEAKAATIGAPNQMTDTPLHLQGNDPDCLLQSARMAEHKQTGKDPGLSAYKDPAVQRKIYKGGSDGGTEVDGFMDIMNERPNIQAELTTGDGPQDIKVPLDKGESVIACVDAGEFRKALGARSQRGTGQGHAVVVTGANQASDGSWQFAVNDPNIPVANVPVNGDGFLRAWDKMGRRLIVVKPKGDPS